MAALKPEQSWPVTPWDRAYRVWRENDAWYTGDVEELSRLYSAVTTGRPTHAVRGVPHTGGLVGGMHRMFWGRPTPPGEDRTRLHIPAPADVAALSSDLLFARPPRIAYGTDQQVPDKAQQRLDLIMSSDQSHAAMHEGGEYTSAFGAAAAVLRWDTETRDHVWWEPVAADVVIPEFRYSALVALNLWTEYGTGTGTVYRHIERLEPGRILHTLYEGTDDKLGRIVPLQDRPETEPYAALVGRDGAEADTILTGISELTAEWWLNMPAKSWRKAGVLAEAGRSDYTGGMKGLFDALDETWSSWMRDLELGKARLVVPAGYLQNNGRGQGATFDTDRSVYTSLNMPGSAAGGAVGDAIEQVQFDIRVTEHEQTAQALLRRILATAGQGELDKDAGTTVDRTATEISVGSQTRDRTRDRKTLYARPFLATLSRRAMLLDAQVFPGKGGGDFAPPEVVFPPAGVANPYQNAQTVGLLRAAKVQSVETSIRMAHPEWGPDEVDEELDRLLDEQQSVTVTDPTAVGRVDPGADPGAVDDPAAGNEPAQQDDTRQPPVPAASR